jgi:O-antigen ligase
MVPLICYASDGILWFRSQGAGDFLAATYGSLAAGGSGGSDNLIVSCILLLTIPTLLLFRLHAASLVLRRNAIFIVLAIWITLSALWSQLPSVSLEWSPAAIVNILFAVYLYVRFSPEEQVNLLLLLGSICLLLSFTLCYTSSSYRDSAGAWRGMYAQKNMCCMETEFLLTPAFYAASKGQLFRVFRWMYIMGSIVLIYMTHSSTGRITLLLLLGFVLATKIFPRLRIHERAALLVSFATLSLVVAILGITASTQIAALFGKDPTLTGRTDIWFAMIPSILKHPLLGYGYRAFWRGYQGESAYVSLSAHWAVPSAHNAFLEIWITLGGVGLAIILFSIIKACKDGFVCLVSSNSPYLAWYASIVVLMLLISTDEAEMVTGYGLMWILYILACVGLSQGATSFRVGRA